jgi:hypothetical protein
MGIPATSNVVTTRFPDVALRDLWKEERLAKVLEG